MEQTHHNQEVKQTQMQDHMETELSSASSLLPAAFYKNCVTERTFSVFGL